MVLNLWIEDLRWKNLPPSSPIICEKAEVLYCAMNPNHNKEFSAASGWLWRFIAKYNLRTKMILCFQGKNANVNMYAS